MNDANHNRADQAFAEARTRVLERDDYTCRGCNFRSPPSKTGASYQEVHHLDDNHANNDDKNLVTICPLCHQSFHIGHTGLSNGGILVWLPEINQADLNHICRSIIIAFHDNADCQGSARSIYAALEARALYLEDIFCEGASDPAFFGQAMLDSDPATLQKEVIAGIRLLPNPAKFNHMVEHWYSHGYKGIPPETWDSLVITLDKEKGSAQLPETQSQGD